MKRVIFVLVLLVLIMFTTVEANEAPLNGRRNGATQTETAVQNVIP